MLGAADDPGGLGGGGDPADRVALGGAAGDRAAVAVEARGVLEVEAEQEAGDALGLGPVAGGGEGDRGGRRRRAARRRPSRRGRRRRRRRCGVGQGAQDEQRALVHLPRPGRRARAERAAAREPAPVGGCGLVRGRRGSPGQRHCPPPFTRSSTPAEPLRDHNRQLVRRAPPAPTTDPRCAEPRHGPQHVRARQVALPDRVRPPHRQRRPAADPHPRHDPGVGTRPSPPPAARPGCRSAPAPPAPRRRSTTSP